MTTDREAVRGATVAALKRAADRAARDQAERDGMAVLEQYPAVIQTALRLAERRAEALRRQVGDISADAASETLAALALAVAGGMPADDDRRGLLVAVTARRAVDKVAVRARRAAGGNDWRAAIRGDAAPSDAPNALEQWSDSALLRRAARYCSGALRTGDQARAVINAARLANLPPMYPRPTGERPAPVMPPVPGGRQAGAHVAYWQARGWSDLPPVWQVRGGTPAARVTRLAGSTVVDGAQRSAAPGAESAYLRGAQAAILRGAFTAEPATCAALDHYQAARLVRRLSAADREAGRSLGDTRRPAFVAWQDAARQAGAQDRGAFSRKVKRAARRLSAAAYALAAMPAAILRPAPPASVAAPERPASLVAVPAPPAPVYRLVTLPPAPPRLVAMPADGKRPARLVAVPPAPGGYAWRAFPADAAPPRPPAPLAVWQAAGYVPPAMPPAPAAPERPAPPAVPLEQWLATAERRAACPVCGALDRDGRAPAAWCECQTCGMSHAPACHHA